MITFNTLGSLDLQDRSDGHQILSVLAQPKRVGFLTYLAIAYPRGLHQRDTLLGIFWPDSTDKKARNALNQTLFVLRRALGQQLFLMNGEPGVGLDPDRLWCDVREFERALANGEKEEALDLYQGNFLEGFFLPGCIEFERWADAERGRLRDLATGAVLSLSQDMESAGNPVGALGWLRRAREWAVYDELVLRRQAELLLALGDRSGAVREYESFARRLSVDLGMEPSEEAQRMLDGPAGVVGGWRRSEAGEETTQNPFPLAPVPDPVYGRRFSPLQTAAVACLAGLIGIGGTLSAPRMWTSATSTSGPVMEAASGLQNVVVLPLENATGDPTLDPLGRTVAVEIVQELAATGLVRVTPIVNPRKASEEPEGQTLSPNRAGNGLQRLHDTEYVVTGSYSEQNGSLAYRTRILETATGEIVVAVDTVMGSSADPTAATERIKRRVAGALAMVLDSRLSDLVRVASHPPSFEAYQLLADGLDAENRAMGTVFEAREVLLDDAAETFLQAAGPDSAFTLPLFFALGLTARNSPEFGARVQALLSRRAELPRWERAMVDYYVAMNSLDKTELYEATRRLRGISPTLDRTLGLAVAAYTVNRPREALKLLAPLGSKPELVEGASLYLNSLYWFSLIDAKMMLGDYEGALSDIKHAQASNDWIALFPREVEALARMGRSEEAVHQSIQYLESTGDRAEHDLWSWLPAVLRGTGLGEEARQVAEVSVAALREMEKSRGFVFEKALVLAGRFDEARRELAEADESEGQPYRRYTLLAYMAAREGHAEEAIRLSETARNISEADVPSRPRWGIMSQVEVAAQLGDLGGAVRFLREAFDQGIPQGSWVLTRWDLTPLYGYEPFEDLIRPKG